MEMSTHADSSLAGRDEAEAGPSAPDERRHPQQPLQGGRRTHGSRLRLGAPRVVVGTSDTIRNRAIGYTAADPSARWTPRVLPRHTSRVREAGDQERGQLRVHRGDASAVDVEQRGQQTSRRGVGGKLRRPRSCRKEPHTLVRQSIENGTTFQKMLEY